MSSKSRYRGQATSKFQISDKPKAAPRKLEEIQAEYGQTASRAGQAQYQVFVFEAELQQLNNRMVELNQEASERAALDKEEQAKSEAEAALAPKSEEQA